MEHVILGKLPKFVELSLVICLNADHHTIRHTLRTNIVVVDVFDVSFTVIAFEIYSAVVVTFEVVIPQFIHFGVNFLIGFSKVLLECASIVTCVVCTRQLFSVVAIRTEVSTLIKEC